MDNINQLIIGVITAALASPFLLKFAKWCVSEFMEWKTNSRQQKFEDAVRDSTSNILNIVDLLENTGQRFGALYVHMTNIHNSGKHMNEMNNRKVTIEREKRFIPVGLKEALVPLLKDKWQNRKIDHTWDITLEKLMTEKYVHIKDLNAEFESGEGLDEIYNKNLGREVLICEIGFVGINYMVLMIQFDQSDGRTNESKIGELRHIASELNELLSSAKYILKHQQ